MGPQPAHYTEKTCGTFLLLFTFTLRLCGQKLNVFTSRRSAQQIICALFPNLCLTEHSSQHLAWKKKVTFFPAMASHGASYRSDFTARSKGASHLSNSSTVREISQRNATNPRTMPLIASPSANSAGEHNSTRLFLAACPE